MTIQKTNRLVAFSKELGIFFRYSTWHGFEWRLFSRKHAAEARLEQKLMSVPAAKSGMAHGTWHQFWLP